MDPSIWWTAAAIGGLLLLSAFFSGSETALTAVSRASLHRLRDMGDRRADTALNVTADNERLIGAVRMPLLGIALMTDSDDTCQRAVADYADFELLPAGLPATR